MPIMDGIEATNFIRKILKKQTPIIALTANAFKQDIDLYLKTGMNDFITKPYDEDDFFRKIEHVLSVSQNNMKDNDGNVLNNKNSLYDLVLIEKISGGNEEFVHKMVSIFLDLIFENVAIFAIFFEQIRISGVYGKSIEKSQKKCDEN